MKNIGWGILKLYSFLYVFLYLGYFFIINLLHSSYSIVSVSAITVPYLLLLFIIMLAWKASNETFRTSKKGKSIWISIIVIGSILPISCGIFLGINEFNSHFNAEKWLNNHSSRVYMVDDLLDKYVLVGMTKEEVIDFLGVPLEINYYQEDDNIVYYLGNERGLISIDSEWLVIEFNQDEIVTQYDVRRD